LLTWQTSANVIIQSKNLFMIIHARAVPSEKMYYNLG
jgi:hypothetical protein